MTPDPETHHLSTAVEALGDRIAQELHACEEVLKTESDVQRRRVAQRRYLTLTERKVA